jgi:hypothetical protein
MMQGAERDKLDKGRVGRRRRRSGLENIPSSLLSLRHEKHTFMSFLLYSPNQLFVLKLLSTYRYLDPEKKSTPKTKL